MTLKTKSANEAKEMLDDNQIILIDVRETDEFQAEHIDGAINMPLSSLDTNELSRLVDSKECVFQCHSGKRAASVVEQLVSANCGNCYLLEDGLTGWKKAGLETQSKGSSLTIFRQVQIVAGFFIFFCTILGLLLNKTFLIVPVFFGAGLFFAGITGWCGMGLLLQKMPWNK